MKCTSLQEGVSEALCFLSKAAQASKAHKELHLFIDLVQVVHIFIKAYYIFITFITKAISFTVTPEQVCL